MHKIVYTCLLVLLVSLLAPLSSFAAFGDEDDDSDNQKVVQVTVDLSMFDYTPKATKKAALLAFLRRNWDIESVEPNRYVGVINSASTTAKAEIVIDNNTLTIKSVKGYSVKPNWLMNLKKDFLVFLVEESY
ncbi:hypothetical protein [Kaarinaea lacus]